MIFTIDFETHGIEAAPNYPPYPIGVAIKADGLPATYLAWGHREGNNCTIEEAGAELRNITASALRDGHRLLFHNAKFDLAVMQKWMGVIIPPPSVIDDTMFLAFLNNPYSKTLSLKPLAQELLGMPPEEKDAVYEWLSAHYLTPEGRKMAPAGKNTFMKYLWLAPTNLVGEYAKGDVDRTYYLYLRLRKVIEDRGMLEAYRREVALVPLLIENEARGIRVDHERLGEDVHRLGRLVERIDDWVRRTTHTPELNLDSGAELANALETVGAIDRSKLLRTAKTGGESLSAESMLLALPPDWAELIIYRMHLTKFLGTFMRPWLKMADQTGGLIHTDWRQIKTEIGGAKTGRFASSPNFQNIPRVPKKEKDLSPLWGLTGIAEIEPLPNLRKYFIPWDKGWVLIDRDNSQQEVRLMAHMGGRSVLEEYKRNPWFDLHQWTQDMLKAQFKIDMERENVKTTNFRIMYGGGVPALMGALQVNKEDAAKIRQAVLDINTSLALLYAATQVRAMDNRPVRTWGGREYYVRPPETVDGKLRTYAYALVNYLIQGSGADCTKEAWRRIGPDTKDFKMYMSIHDEFLASVPAECLHQGMEKIKTRMESIPLSVPLLTEGKWSAESWGAMRPYDKKGVRCPM